MKTRATEWFDTELEQVFYGIKVFFNGQWLNAGDENGLFLFNNEADRDEKRKELREKQVPTKQ